MSQVLKAVCVAVLSVVVIGLLCGAVAAQARGPIEPPSAPTWGTPAPNFNGRYIVYEESFLYTTPFSITDLRPEARYANKESYELHSLMVFRPYTNGVLLQNRPVVFYVHGGGWTDGYAEWYSYTAKSLTGEMGWVTVVIDYRLTSDEVFVADEYCPDKVTCALTQNVPLRTKAAWYDDNISDVAAALYRSWALVGISWILAGAIPAGLRNASISHPVRLSGSLSSSPTYSSGRKNSA